MLTFTTVVLLYKKSLYIKKPYKCLADTNVMKMLVLVCVRRSF
jgi:hypothetical protein